MPHVGQGSMAPSLAHWNGRAWICFGLLLASCVSPPAAAVLPQPNVVLFLCDDLGYGDLGCTGHPVIQTPNIDTLARDGLRLTAMYAAAPMCSPSFSSPST